MQVSAKTDYALRAASELALAATEDAGPIKGDWISETQGIPKKFMENILRPETLRDSPYQAWRLWRLLARVAG